MLIIFLVHRAEHERDVALQNVEELQDSLDEIQMKAKDKIKKVNIILFPRSCTIFNFILSKLRYCGKQQHWSRGYSLFFGTVIEH